MGIDINTHVSIHDLNMKQMQKHNVYIYIRIHTIQIGLDGPATCEGLAARLSTRLVKEKLLQSEFTYRTLTMAYKVVNGGSLAEHSQRARISKFQKQGERGQR